MASKAIFIPTEIHHAIAQFLDDEDLYNYRLVCKLFADIGAGEIFRVIAFHASQKSSSRLVAISEHPSLCAYVRTIAWDTNRWDLGFNFVDLPTAEEHWRGYLSTTIKEARGVVSRPWRRSRANVLSANFNAYYHRVDEEKRLLTAGGQFTFGPLIQTFAKFRNLKEILILNGDIRYKERKPYIHWKICGGPARGEPMSRGEKLHDAYDGYLGPAVHEFWTLLLAAPKTLRKLRIDAVHWTSFCQTVRKSNNVDYGGKHRTDGMFTDLDPANPLHHRFQHLTSLHLTIITAYSMDEDHSFLNSDVQNNIGASLRTFLHGLSQLESLHLGLDIPGGLFGSERTCLPFHDTVASVRIWPCLRKLSLKCFSISEEQLTDLLISHSETLQDLWLTDICLDQTVGLRKEKRLHADRSVPQGDWIRLLATLQEHLHLKKAVFQRFLCNSPESFIDLSLSWHTREFAEALEQYLVHGGTCPLTKENAYDWESAKARAYEAAISAYDDAPYS